MIPRPAKRGAECAVRLRGAVYPLYTPSVAKTVRVQKWGNSLGVRLSQEIAAQAGVRAGSLVRIDVRRGVVQIRGAVSYRLDELLRAVRRGHLHDETEWGRARGREAW